MYKNRFKQIITAGTILSVLLLAGCSGPNEEVRVTTCKKLAVELADVNDKVEWQEPQQTVHDPEYAVIKLKAKSQRLSAACWYEYEDTGEETYESHVDPISAYSTVPYEMTLNGRSVPAQELYQAMKDLRIKAGKRLLEKAKHWSQEALKK